MFLKQLRECVVCTINLFHVVKNTCEYQTIRDNYKIDKISNTKFSGLTIMIYHKICIISLYGMVSPKMIFT